jgi:hypothetical protein
MAGEVFKVVLAGGRYFCDYKMFSYKVDLYLQNKSNIEIISGGAMGADNLAERYAKEKGYKITILKADWATYSKFAGPKRNAEMAELADAAIIFWDGTSRGSLNMINEAKKKGLLTKVVRYDNLPILAHVSVKKYFPKTMHKSYNNKPLTCIKHLDNWIGTLESRGLKVVHLEYEFRKESYEV